MAGLEMARKRGRRGGRPRVIGPEKSEVSSPHWKSTPAGPLCAEISVSNEQRFIMHWRGTEYEMS